MVTNFLLSLRVGFLSSIARGIRTRCVKRNSKTSGYEDFEASYYDDISGKQTQTGARSRVPLGGAIHHQGNESMGNNPSSKE